MSLAQFCSFALASLVLFSFARQEPEKPWDLSTPAPVPDGRIAKLDRLEDYACAKCHAEVVEEWAATAHALAWVDPIYREEIADKKKPEACHGCHIPKPMLLGNLGEKPEARADTPEAGLHHFGVSCESCHLGPDGAMHGPRGTQTEAHPSKRSDSMIGQGSSALCASCHRINIGPVIGIGKDFEQSNQAARGRSCVGCHMAPIERRWANSPGGTVPAGTSAGEAPTRMGRSHALQTPRDPAFLRRAFEATARVDGGKTVVTIRNVAGHRVPALIGRSLDFTAAVLDEKGKVLAEKELTLDTRTHLPVDQSIDLTIEAAGREVRLTGLHGDPRLDKPVPFLDLRLPTTGR